jgi:hypothetical protein
LDYWIIGLMDEVMGANHPAIQSTTNPVPGSAALLL